MKEAFYLAASPRQIKKSPLCGPGASAVDILFWTRVTADEFQRSHLKNYLLIEI